MSDNLNIDDIISLVKENNKQFDTKIFIPSLNKQIHCKPMNASHLKSIIKTTLSGVFTNIVFNQTMYMILSEILDPSIKLSEINTFDKLCILLQLRNTNVKKTISVEMKNEDSTIIQEFVIDEIIDNIKNKIYVFDDREVVAGPYTITLGFPSLDQEYKSDNYFEKTKLKNIKEDDKNQLKELFGPLFIHEISQYIKSIKIKDAIINLNSLPIEDRNKIIDNLSGSVISPIISTIDEKFGNIINQIQNIEKEIKGVVYKGVISFTPSLFS